MGESAKPELPSEGGDVDVHYPGILLQVEPPDAAVKKIPGNRRLRIPRKGPQDEEFLVRNRQRHPSRGNGERRERDSAPGVIDETPVGPSGNPAKQFFGIPGFHEIVDAAAQKGEIHVRDVSETKIEGALPQGSSLDSSAALPPDSPEEFGGKDSDVIGIEIIGKFVEKREGKMRIAHLSHSLDFFRPRDFVRNE